MEKKISFDSVQEGEDFHKLKKDPITNEQLARYAGASGDFNPIHYDQEFAKSQGLPGNIAQGMLLMGMIGQMITERVDTRYVKNFNIKFVGMTRPTDQLLITGKIKKKLPDQKRIIVEVQAGISDTDIKAKGEAIIECC